MSTAPIHAPANDERSPLRQVCVFTACARHSPTLAIPSTRRLLDWLGIDAAGQFDPTAFDVDEVNAAL